MNYNFSSNLFEQDAGGGEGSYPWAHPCDACRAAPSAVYCRADAAYLCAACDVRVHAANSVALRHQRVRVCDGCERAPAALACSADAAELCAACDAQVHSANPLAGRHQRVPVLPLPAAAAPASSGLAEAPTATLGDKEEEVDSWLLFNKDCNNNMNNNNNNNSMFGAEVDEFLDLVGYNSCYENQNQEKQYDMQEQLQEQQEQQKQMSGEKEGNECVVPSQVLLASEQHQQQNAYGMVMGVEQEASMSAWLSAYTASISHSVS